MDNERMFFKILERIAMAIEDGNRKTDEMLGKFEVLVDIFKKESEGSGE